jgi:outer membrane protein assembly factor BamB
MNHILRIVAAHVLLSMLVVPAGVAMADRNSNHSNQHTGTKPGCQQTMLAGARAKLPPPTPATPGSQMIWNFTSDGGVSSSPALSSDGKVLYVGSEDSNLYSVDAATGSKILSFKTGDIVSASPAVSSDGKVVHVAVSLRPDGLLYPMPPFSTPSMQ